MTPQTNRERFAALASFFASGGEVLHCPPRAAMDGVGIGRFTPARTIIFRQRWRPGEN